MTAEMIRNDEKCSGMIGYDFGQWECNGFKWFRMVLSEPEWHRVECLGHSYFIFLFSDIDPTHRCVRLWLRNFVFTILLKYSIWRLSSEKSTGHLNSTISGLLISSVILEMGMIDEKWRNNNEYFWHWLKVICLFRHTENEEISHSCNFDTRQSFSTFRFVMNWIIIL
jgi:hypothetical protein